MTGRVSESLDLSDQEDEACDKGSGGEGEVKSQRLEAR